MRLRVLVAEDDPPFLDTLAALLEPEFELVGTAATSDSVMELLRRSHPDVVVLDLEIAERGGVELTRKIATHVHSPAVVVYSLESDPDIVKAVFDAGALGYVQKARIAIDLIAAVKSASNKRRFVSPN